MILMMIVLILYNKILLIFISIDSRPVLNELSILWKSIGSAIKVVFLIAWNIMRSSVEAKLKIAIGVATGIVIVVVITTVVLLRDHVDNRDDYQSKS